MCNRYSASKLKAIRALGSRYAPGHSFTKQWHPIYNIPPKSDVPVVVNGTEQPLRVMRWGTWSIDGLLAEVTADSVATKPLWENAMQHRRCLILADGFFTWETIGPRKFGHYFTVTIPDAFAIAGIWLPANADQPERCLMVTTESNPVVAHFNDRMPAILSEWNAAAWLGNKPLSPETIRKFCQPYPAEKMSHWNSPPEVTGTDFQDPAAVRPWEPRPAVTAESGSESSSMP